MTESDCTYRCDICGSVFETPGGMGCHKRWEHAELYTRDAVCEAIQRLAEQKGRAPTIKEMRAEGTVSAATAKNQFDSWNAALQAAGFKPPSKRNVSKSTLIDELQRLYQRFERPPTAGEMNDHGAYTCSTFQNKFGSWNDALRRAGFELHREAGVTRQDLLDEIHRLVEELGRVPTVTEIKSRGTNSHRCYYDRFEGWAAAVQAAGYEPVGRASGEDHPYWKDEVESLPWAPNWSQQRQCALERDDFECQTPGCSVTREIHRERHEKDLHVHHVIPRRQFVNSDGNYDAERANALDSLVALCREHHQFWERMTPLQPDIR